MENKERLKRKVKEVYVQARIKGLSVEVMRHAFTNGKKEETDADGKEQGRKNVGITESICHLHWLFYVVLYAFALAGAIFLSAYLRTSKYPFCALNHSDYSREMIRPLVNCDFCRNLYSVPVEENIDRESFMNRYAFKGVPVLIKGATKNWTAPSEFNYRMLKDLFFKTGGPTEFVGCEYLPYASEYGTLTELFRNMPESMGQGNGRPWYVGWHICWPEMRKELGRYYQRPSFLPEGYTTSPSDYMFMGVAGRGAVIHLDIVIRPTWQAQITGKKTWTLIPPTECQSICHSLNVTVDSGEIIVLDTNIWFHSTLVHPGQMSIAIGTEFD